MLWRLHHETLALSAIKPSKLVDAVQDGKKNIDQYFLAPFQA
jgi:hypothetical protein